MPPRDWALVAFTLLMQASVGTLLVAVAVSVPAGAAGGSARPFTAPIAISLWTGALALVAASMHLGHPVQAWLAVSNVRASWLSREVVVSIAFVALLAVLLVQRRAAADPATMMAVVAGVLVLIAMSRLYLVAAQPAWNRALTPLTFFASALLLGAVIALATASVAPSAAPRLALVATGLAVAQCLATTAFVAALPAEPAAAISAAAAGSMTAWLTFARVAAAMTAMLLLAMSGGGTAAPAVAALGFVLISELAGRVLFYAGAASIGPF